MHRIETPFIVGMFCFDENDIFTKYFEFWKKNVMSQKLAGI